MRAVFMVVAIVLGEEPLQVALVHWAKMLRQVAPRTCRISSLCGEAPEKQPNRGPVRGCTSNPFQLLDLIHHQFVELLGFCNFNHGAYVGVALSCVGHLGYVQTREMPSGIACLVRSHRDNKVGSHDLPSTALFDCSRSLQSRQWCVQGTASRRALEIG